MHNKRLFILICSRGDPMSLFTPLLPPYRAYYVIYDIELSTCRVKCRV